MSRHALNTLRRVFAVAAIPALTASILVAAPVAARTPVDPNTLNPAPPDFFNAECWDGAGGTVCTLHFSDDPIVDEPSGIVCGSTELLYSQTRSVIGKRFYDTDGNLVQRHFRESMAGTFTNADSGKVATWTQHDTIIDNLVVPGDLATGITHLSGLFTRAIGPDGATIQTDAGMFLVDAATGESIRQSAHHPFDDYFANGDAAALQPLCDALS